MVFHYQTSLGNDRPSRILSSMDPPDPEHKVILGKVALFAAVVVVASMGAVSRLFKDSKDVGIKITKAMIFSYVVSGLTAGLIISLLLYNHLGPTYLLVGVSGVAGFGSVQILSFLTLLLEGVLQAFAGWLKKFFPQSKDKE